MFAAQVEQFEGQAPRFSPPATMCMYIYIYIYVYIYIGIYIYIYIYTCDSCRRARPHCLLMDVGVLVHLCHIRVNLCHLFIEFPDGIIGFIERIYLTGKREMTILRSTGIYNLCALLVLRLLVILTLVRQYRY